MLCLDWSYPFSSPHLLDTFLQPCSDPLPASHPAASMLRIDSSLAFGTRWRETLVSHLWPPSFISPKMCFPFCHATSSTSATLVISSFGSSSHPIEKRYLINSALEALFISFFFFKFDNSCLLLSLCLRCVLYFK